MEKRMKNIGACQVSLKSKLIQAQIPLRNVISSVLQTTGLFLGDDLGFL